MLRIPVGRFAGASLRAYAMVGSRQLGGAGMSTLQTPAIGSRRQEIPMRSFVASTTLSTVAPTKHNTDPSRFFVAVDEAKVKEVTQVLLEKKLFNADRVRMEVDWFFRELELDVAYHREFNSEQIAEHLTLLIGAKELARATPFHDRMKFEHDLGNGDSVHVSGLGVLFLR
jgi:hypothetical protein